MLAATAGCVSSLAAGQIAEGRWRDAMGAGRALAQRLVGDGEAVLDVPAKLAARVRVYSQGHGRKTDADDAVSIRLAALNSTGVAVVRRDDTLVSLRLLCDRRDELGGLRTQAVCRLPTDCRVGQRPLVKGSAPERIAQGSLDKPPIYYQQEP
jgi:hypothetical protein